MPGFADANLLVALARPSDALHERARRHVERHDRLVASTVAVLEAFGVARRDKVSLWDFLGFLEGHFDIEDIDLLRDVAAAVDDGLAPGVFDAYHAALALARGEFLHTADERLLKSDYSTVAF